MQDYDLYVMCPHCKGFHDAFARVSLDATFDVRRVSDVYGHDVPTHFYQAVSSLRCDKTNTPVNQNNPDAMVLAQVGKPSLHSKAKRAA